MQLNIWLIGDKEFIYLKNDELINSSVEGIYNYYINNSDEIIEIHKKDYRYAINRKAIAYMCLFKEE